MAPAGVNFQRWVIDVSDPELTRVWVFCQALGDAPFMVHGWHGKTFPARFTAADLLSRVIWEDGGPVMWPAEAPAEMTAEASIEDRRPYTPKSQREAPPIPDPEPPSADPDARSARFWRKPGRFA